jgi:hypothetical protein
VWLYGLSPYSIRFSVHPALCESTYKFQLELSLTLDSTGSLYKELLTDNVLQI